MGPPSEEYEPSAKIGFRHVAVVQPWLRRIGKALSDAGIVDVFLRRSVSLVDAGFVVDAVPARLALNWVVQDFCYFALLRLGAADASAVPRDVKELHPSDAEEGRRSLTSHYRRERASSIARAAKRKAAEVDPELPCEGCGISFALSYGEIGVGYIEAHHLVPLSERTYSQKASVRDGLPPHFNPMRVGSVTSRTKTRRERCTVSG